MPEPSRQLERAQAASGYDETSGDDWGGHRCLHLGCWRRFGDGTVAEAARSVGAFGILKDLGGFIGALIALAGAVIAWIATTNVAEQQKRDKIEERLMAHTVTVMKIAELQSRAYKRRSKPTVDTGKLVEPLVAYIDSEEVFRLRSDVLLRGENSGIEIYITSALKSIDGSADNIEKRFNEVVSKMKHELRFAIGSRMRLLNERNEIADLSRRQMVRVEQYKDHIAKGSDIDISHLILKVTNYTIEQ
ncbi:hypothetical protein [Ancylobacter dichloromethanicus]|uniref:hypothetical protein n=1 Tax=Ancylobacter dichloromethanicus TaxID=518825 RepID=UPI00360E2FDA